MRHICIIITIALFLAGGAAFADARQHFLAGQDYYTQGRYEKAIEEFNEAYRLDPRPKLLFNIAQAWEKLGELEKAVDYLKRYLEAEPNNDEAKSLRDKVVTLEERIAATGVTIACNVEGATVYVDGREIGETPVAGTVKMAVGTHKIQISKRGYDDFKMSVAITAGNTIPVDAALEVGEAGPPPPVAASGEVSGDPIGAPKDRGKKVGALDILPWTVAGVGVVGIVVGWGVIGSMASKETDTQKATKKALTADILGIAGAAVAVGGATWGIIHVIKKKKAKKNAGMADAIVVPFVGDRMGGAVASVQF